MSFDSCISKKIRLYPVNNVSKGFSYWYNLLTEKCLDMYIYEGLPESLPAQFVERLLIMWGYATIFKADGELMTVEGSLSGVGKYYLPTTFTYAAPWLKGGYRTVGKDCAIIYNSKQDIYFYRGLRELISRYARMLADIESSINIVVVNQRATRMDIVADAQTAAEVDRARESIEKGAHYTINQKSIIDRYFPKEWAQVPQSNQIIQLIDARDRILSNFLEEIGVKSINMNKRERMIQSEVTADTQLLLTNVEDMLSERQAGVDRVNKMFGTNITVVRNPVYDVSMNIEELEEGETDGNIEKVSISEQIDN